MTYIQKNNLHTAFKHVIYLIIKIIKCTNNSNSLKKFRILIFLKETGTVCAGGYKATKEEDNSLKYINRRPLVFFSSHVFTNL